MACILRWYQDALKSGIYREWGSGKRNVCAVAPTGAGKTRLMGKVATEQPSGVAIAHRQELISQISTALAEEGVPHHVHGNSALTRMIRANHIAATGRQWLNAKSGWSVAGVDTLTRMGSDPWMGNVGLIMQDECHHVLRSNKWGKAWSLFPQAYGLGVTATPGRADKKGLGSHADGVFDSLVEEVQMRELIDQGYLTDYRIIAPDPSDLGLHKIDISDATGDYNSDQLRKHFRENSKIVGDVVSHYLKYAPGKLGVTFAVDIESASRIAQEFRAHGVGAEVLSGKTPDQLRQSLLKRFKNREFLQLVSVDILGEGFDLPAIEVVSFARPTESFSLYAQQFGRVLRLMIDGSLHAIWESLSVPERLEYIARSQKPYALIIDHVGNIVRHNLPDKRRFWTLDRGTKRAKTTNTDALPLRICLNPTCLQPYSRDHYACPNCGKEAPPPADRSGPDAVDGDLFLWDEAALAKMRGEVARVDSPAYVPRNVAPHVQRAIMNNHHERIEAQRELRDAIALWAGKWSMHPDRQNYRRFFLTFGVDVVTACSLNKGDSEILKNRIMENIYAA